MCKTVRLGWWGGGPCDFSFSPSLFGLDFGTLDFGLGLDISHFIQRIIPSFLMQLKNIYSVPLSTTASLYTIEINLFTHANLVVFLGMSSYPLQRMPGANCGVKICLQLGARLLST